MTRKIKFKFDYHFLPEWEVAQAAKKRQEDRLLWAYVNGQDDLADYLKKDIERLNKILSKHFN